MIKDRFIFGLRFMGYEQTILQLLPKQTPSFSRFIVGESGPALSSLRDALVPARMGTDTLYLLGAAGTGKSHLLQAAYAESRAHDRSAIYLPLSKMVVWEVAVFRSLEQYAVVLLDDVDALFGMVHWEEALFNLLNRLKDAGCLCVMSANLPPNQEHVDLPDLASRLQAALLSVLQPLDDADKIALLLSRAETLGFSIPESVAQYIVRHYGRSTHALMDHVHRLDRASLVKHRPSISIPFVKSVLQEKA
jgi:DnaA-homolog protein